MLVGIVTSEVPSCLFYRATGPAQALADAGEIEVELLTSPEDGTLPLNVRYARRRHGPEPVEPVGLIDVPDVDVVVLTRGVFPSRIHDVIRFLQREGIAVVVDYDDAYDRMPPALLHLYKVTPKLNQLYNWQHAKAAAQLADLVTVSTPALQRYRRDAIVLRNCIPARYLDMPLRRDDRPAVGWGGVVAGHPGDLRECGLGVAQAVREFDARFLNVGDGVDVKRELCLDRPPQVTGIVPFDEYPQRLTRMDVAIAPLRLNDYANAKSALKVLEALATGGQYAASPSFEYRRLHVELQEWCDERAVGVPGAIAAAGKRGREWRQAVSLGLRRVREGTGPAMASIGREFIRDRYLLEDRAVEWAEAWEQAIRNRRARPWAA